MAKFRKIPVVIDGAEARWLVVVLVGGLFFYSISDLRINVLDSGTAMTDKSLAREREERTIAETYLENSGWKKDACGWWIPPFGYGLEEAINLHRDAAEKTAYAFEESELKNPGIIKYWIESERAR